MKMKQEKVEINDGHYHEMMDRLHVQMETLDEHLLKHPIGQQHKGVNKLLIEAIVTLLQAYQLTGKLAHEKAKKNKTNARRKNKSDN